MTWTIRPNGLCRIGGMPVSEVRALEAPLCVESLSKVDAVDEVVRFLSEELGEKLYNEVGGCDDTSLRRAMINLRRAIYQRPTEAADDLAAALQRIDHPGLTSSLRLFALLLEQRRGWLDTAEQWYAKESAAGRRALGQLAEDDDFRKGLLGSSRSLYGRLSKIDHRPSEDKQWSKLHRGVLKYVSRTAMKATPFGRFCAVIPVTISSDPHEARPRVRLDGSPRSKRGVARIAKQVCSLLLPPIVVVPRVRGALGLTLNPTTSVTGDRVEFLAAEGARDVFRSLDLVPALGATIEAVSGDEPSYQETLAALSGRPGARDESVRGFLDGLINIGLLRLRTGIAEQELNWEPRLAELLDLSGLSGVARARDFLRDAPRLMREYESGDATVRSSVASRLETALKEAVKTLAVRVPVKYDGLILEDASADASVRISVDGPLGKGFEELARLVEITGALGWPRAEMATMRQVFDSHYGGDCVSVPILQFYNDFYRVHQKEHLVRREKARDNLDEDYDLGNPLGIPIVDEIRDANRRVNRLVWSRCLHALRGTEEVRISLTELADAVGQDFLAETDARSATVFCELLNDRLGTIVIDRGRSAIGYGKFWSRFMHLFNDDFTASVRDDNDQLGSGRLAEIYVDGSYNANLHPPLAHWEIEYPTVEARAGDGTIALGRLVVARNPDDEHRLDLVDRSDGTRVSPVDLGFLHPTIRPHLFQLLTQFSPGRSVAFEDPARIALRAAGLDWSEVIPIPRVRFGDAIVVFRKRWLVKSTALPVKDGRTSQFEYFATLRSWRMAMGLPREVYVRLLALSPRTAPSDDGDESPKDRPKPPVGFHPDDTHKPQYVDFESPGLVEVLGRLMHDAAQGGALVFEERFPPEAPLRAGTGNDEGYVSELVLLVERSAD